jgi:hypothetical protein
MNILSDFCYILLRDHLTLGEVDAILNELENLGIPPMCPILHASAASFAATLEQIESDQYGENEISGPALDNAAAASSDPGVVPAQVPVATIRIVVEQ